MSGESSVTALHIYCARHKLPNPTYTYLMDENDGFLAKCSVQDIEAIGNGRSKRDAKHLSAANLLKKINDNKSDSIKEIDELTNVNRDMLKELRDFCVKNEIPLPEVNVIQQSGSPHAPQFVALCTVASIKRYGCSDNKKDARQKASIEMMNSIHGYVEIMRESEMQLQLGNTKQQTLEDIESERRFKFKTYRELVDSGGNQKFGVKLCDRHNYFKGYFPHLKKAALDIIKSTDYESDQSKAMDIFNALKLTPTITTIESKSSEPLLFIELNSEYDCVFLDEESKIYGKIIQYFSEMLI